MSNQNANANSIEASTKTVTVGCKLPNGLHLDLKANDGATSRVTLKGANDSRIVGGFGLTENVSAEFMERWLKKNAKHPAVVGGAIFIHSDMRSAESLAKERRDLTTGLDAIDPVKSGMLRNETGQDDPKAIADYNKRKQENPARNRQVQE
jgi:hypothetical protein